MIYFNHFPQKCSSNGTFLTALKHAWWWWEFRFDDFQGPSQLISGSLPIWKKGVPWYNGEHSRLWIQWSRFMSRWDLSVWASLVTQRVKNPPVMQENPVQFLGQEFPWRRDKLPTPIFLGFPGGSAGKEPPATWETWVQSLSWEDPLENSYPLQYSGLENSMDCIVPGVAKSQTQLSNLQLHLHLPIILTGPWSA